MDSLKENKRGKGYWKFNNDLLRNMYYTGFINNRIRNIKNEINMTDKNALWEYTKCQIRSDTMIYSSLKAKNDKEKESEIKKKLEELEKILNESETINQLHYLEYIQTKGLWENHLKRINNGIITRSKANWVEDGEKNSKYFLNLEKRNYNNTCIKSIINKNNKEINNMNDILEEQKMFYKELYTTKINSKDINAGIINNFILDDNIKTLSDSNKELCDHPITLEECAKALKELANNKSPGSDGFTTNFYKFFWLEIRDILFDSYKYSFKTQSLTSFQKMGILNLLPKKDKDLRYLANWRPVSLLNTDYKILTKLLATRLQKVIPTLVDSDQVGYIKGRYIGENVRILFDTLTHTDLNNLEAYITQVDFEKAFDSIEWDFLFKTLNTLNFGQDFICWIKILYKDISACVGNNGNYSEYFKLSRSIRQGCPISALLFLLVIEMLANKIRNDKNIKGINIGNTILKIAMMADDATLLLSSVESISKAIYIFNDFYKCSGLKLNLNKTEIIPIGSQLGKDIDLPLHLQDIKIKSLPFKGLGVWYSNKEEEIIKLNFEDRIKKINTLLNIWKTRNLSLKGKITIIKSLIIPQVHFLFAMVAVPEIILKNIEKILFRFLWNSKTSKVKKNTIIAPIEQGGLGMVDIFASHETAKCSWIRRFFDSRNAKWKETFKIMINIDPQLLNRNFDLSISNKCLTIFHKHILSSWYKIMDKEPYIYKDIINEYILYNKYVANNKKILQIQDFPKQHDKNKVINLKIRAILNDRNQFIIVEELNYNLAINVSTIQYNTITSYVLYQKIGNKLYNYKEKYESITTVKTVSPEPKIKTILKNITAINSKDLYNKFMELKIEPPAAINKWTKLFDFTVCEV